MIKVKVCGLTDPSNVKEIMEAKPDFMGFIFYPGSPRYVGEYPEITLFDQVPSRIKKTGVFLNEDNQKIVVLANRFGLDIVQLHGNESPVACFELKSSGLSVIKSFNIDMEFGFDLLDRYAPCCDYFLFDSKSEAAGGSGRKFNWEKLEEYAKGKPFFLSGGIGPEDTELLNSVNNKYLFAVDINSLFETAPGIKDSCRVKTFINAIKKDQL